MEKVYFIKEITPENIVKIYDALNKDLPGKVAVKVHSGEKGNQNFLHPEFLKPIIEHVDGCVVECNTAYAGERNETSKHVKLLKDHGWSDYFNVDIMDSTEPDVVLEIPNALKINKNYVGNSINNYDSMLVVSHFKGHPMGGFGGALKQLSIGCASSRGKAWIHSAGVVTDQNVLWDHVAKQDDFIMSMADAASSVVKHFNGNMAFINIMCNLSVDCDCCAVAENPCMKDIGILASLDPIALDKACLDLIYNSKDEGRDHFVERVERQHGTYIIDCADKLNFGSSEYELVEIK